MGGELVDKKTFQKYYARCKKINNSEQNNKRVKDKEK